jgi:fatty acid desaturase
MKHDSLLHLMTRARDTRVDRLLIGIHACLWLAVPSYFMGVRAALENYVMITWLMGLYLPSVFLVNHLGRATPQKGHEMPNLILQLATSRNITASSWIACLYFGGLNSQIEHHLFPWVPSFRLRRARAIVRDLCTRNGLRYEEVSYWAALQGVYRYVKELSGLDTDRR